MIELVLGELLEIINEIKEDSSRTGKEALLRKYKDNEEFREVLRFVFDPYIVTGLSKKKINKKVKSEVALEPNVLKSLSEAMDYLKQNNTGRDIDILIIQDFIATNLKTDEEINLAKSIFTKDLKIGLTAKTINKVYTGKNGEREIDVFDVMLAESFAKKESHVKDKFYVTLKIDGNRCIAIKENNTVKLFTRKGKPIEGITELEEEIMAYPNNTVLDGELLVVNEDNLPSAELFRATQKAVRKDGEKKNIEFHVFDMLSVNEFRDGKSIGNYEFRREAMESLHNFISRENKFKYLKILPVLYSGDDKSIVTVLMKWAEENKYEGLMINTADGLYENKRSNNLLKVKSFITADLLCVSIEEGTGRNEGRLGAINVEFKGSLVGVGSGFNDEKREYYWKNPSAIAGKIVEVEYFEESMDSKTKQLSMRFPTFVRLREDKGVEDIRYE